MIKIFLQVVESKVLFSVIEQHGSLTCGKHNTPRREFEASNGWKIVSNRKPWIDLEEKIVFIRGAYESDNENLVIAHCETLDADVVHSEILKAFKEFKKQNYFSGKDGKAVAPFFVF